VWKAEDRIVHKVTVCKLDGTREKCRRWCDLVREQLKLLGIGDGEKVRDEWRDVVEEAKGLNGLE